VFTKWRVPYQRRHTFDSLDDPLSSCWTSQVPSCIQGLGWHGPSSGSGCALHWSVSQHVSIQSSASLHSIEDISRQLLGLIQPVTRICSPKLTDMQVCNTTYVHVCISVHASIYNLGGVLKQVIRNNLPRNKILIAVTVFLWYVIGERFILRTYDETPVWRFESYWFPINIVTWLLGQP
jgi:hypothetical protein